MEQSQHTIILIGEYTSCLARVNPTTDPAAKAKAIDAAIASIERQFGKGSILRMNEDDPNHTGYPTGSLTLDRALGIGGFSEGVW